MLCVGIFDRPQFLFSHVILLLTCLYTVPLFACDLDIPIGSFFILS